MKKFIYTSVNPCHLTIKIDGKSKEMSFCKDVVYDLPEDDKVVKRMIAQGLLTPADSLDKKTKTNQTKNPE